MSESVRAREKSLSDEKNSGLLIWVNWQSRCIEEMVLLLVDNKSNIVCLSISIFKKPNVNGTLERTKSAPQAGKSAQNKRE